MTILRRLKQHLFPQLHVSLDYWPLREAYDKGSDHAFLRPFSQHLVGWAFHPKRDTRIVLSRGESEIFTLSTMVRQDVLAAYPYCPQALESGFSLHLPSKVWAVLGNCKLLAKTESEQIELWTSPLSEESQLTTSDIESLILESNPPRLFVHAPSRSDESNAEDRRAYHTKPPQVTNSILQEIAGLIEDSPPIPESSSYKRKQLSIIIPVYNALDATIGCLRSILQYADPEHQIIIVNDSSDGETTETLRQLCQKNPRLTLVDREQNGGFIEACFSGLEAAKKENDILLVNSDVIATPHAITNIHKALYVRNEIAMASPLSTGSPHMQIDLKPGDSLENAAENIHSSHKATFPTVITPEGQFLAIRRWAIEEFGFFDRIFDRGFGEESDLAMRYLSKGLDTICADNTLIHHRRKASFGTEGAEALKKKNGKIFFERWREIYEPAFQVFQKQDPLAQVRYEYEKMDTQTIEESQVVFLLQSLGGSGGSLSVYQHVQELTLRGIKCAIVSLSPLTRHSSEHLVQPIYIPAEELIKLRWSDQRVIATFWKTAFTLNTLKQDHPDVTGYYYVQGHEPWFSPPNTADYKEAEKSYKLDLQYVVKTHFLEELLKKKYQLAPHRIRPGINRLIFYPEREQESRERLRIFALVTQDSLWRSAELLLDVLYQASKKDCYEITIAGDTEGLAEHFPSSVTILPRLSQAEVAKRYRRSDITFDLSELHGFGRIGLEAMSSGTVPILADSGGIREYARHEQNALIVNSPHTSNVLDALARLHNDRQLLKTLRHNGLSTAEQYSEVFATDDWLKILERECPEDTLLPSIREHQSAHLLQNGARPG